MKDRLQQFLQLEQLTPARLSDIMGVQRSGLSHILSGRNKPGFDFIQRLLLKFPALSADWLITGKGKMYKELKDLKELKDVNESDTSLNNDEEIDVEADMFEYASSQPSENSIKVNPNNNVQKNRQLRKILLVYSDNTFDEIKPGKVV